MNEHIKSLKIALEWLDTEDSQKIKMAKHFIKKACETWPDSSPRWVGLTDKEFLEIPLMHWSVNGQLAYGKTIQAQLKEKNT